MGRDGSMVILSRDEHQPAKKNTVTIAIIEQVADEVLLLQRNPDAYPNAPDPFPRAWELIGGHVEDGEEPPAAAHRELHEETGIVAPALALVGVSPFLSEGVPANNWIYMVLVEQKPPVVLSQEHLAYAWRPLADTLHMSLAFKHSCIIEAIVSEVQ